MFREELYIEEKLYYNIRFLFSTLKLILSVDLA